MTHSPRIVFMGTPEFAVPSLRTLIEKKYNIVGVVTAPDKPAGRGLQMKPSPIKVLAMAHALPLLETASLKKSSVQDQLRSLNADLFVVVAFGRLLPKVVLDMPKNGCLNVHPSLLPKYRGPAPLHWPLINGDTETGVAIMRMSEGMDEGDVLMQTRTPIDPNENAGMLHDRLSIQGAELLDETITKWLSDKIKATAQNHAHATYAPMIDDTVCKIDWTKSALEIHNLIRGVSPRYKAHGKWNGKRVIVHASRLVDATSKTQEAGVIRLDVKNALHVQCGSGILEILELTVQDKKRMSGSAFRAGLTTNARLT